MGPPDERMVRLKTGELLREIAPTRRQRRAAGGGRGYTKALHGYFAKEYARKVNAEWDAALAKPEADE